MRVVDNSLICIPLDFRYQNRNAFMLDAAAARKNTDRDQISVHLRAHVTPTRARVSVFERLFAPMVDQRLGAKDHRSQRLATTTSDHRPLSCKDNGLPLRAQRAQRDQAFVLAYPAAGG